MRELFSQRLLFPLQRTACRLVAWFEDLRFRLLITRLRGGLTLQEARYLRHIGAGIPCGDLLEVGSFRGMSAVALYAGLRQAPGDLPRQVYCIEPHRTFVGVYGGRFGPEDRAGFFRAMLRSGAYRGVALVNLGSRAAARGWQRPLGLAFIDGDHNYEAVSEDVRNWAPHLIPGGLLVFDDALDEQIGPYRVIRELLDTGRYHLDGVVGKVVALRKEGSSAPPLFFQPNGRRRILVVTSELYLSGGLLRFERAGRALARQGHEVTFCTLRSGDPPEGWTGELAVIDLEEAWGRDWDVTMLPGRAGFDENGRKAGLRTFTDPRFGLRVQHILNDRTHETAFLLLNREFKPHLVVFNNCAWPTGSFESFSANEFHTLTGGVDVEAFSNCRLRGVAAEIVIGGQARKNPAPLIACLERLPPNYRLKLFGGVPAEVAAACANHTMAERIELCGILSEAALPAYYAGVDVVVSTETYAGWSNLVAEAMAAGVPVICTPAGTEAIASDEETALVIPHPDPDLIAEALNRLREDPALGIKLAERARRKMRSLDWEHYARRLLELTEGGRHPHYYHEPSLGLFGKWTTETRMIGLDALFSEIADKRVLDVGAAEGLLAKACLDAGASRVDGFDIDAGRIDHARRLCAGSAARFFVANLNSGIDWLKNGLPESSYDVVLYLGVHHHLNHDVRTGQLRRLAALCRETFAIRTTTVVYCEDSLHAIMTTEGFVLAREASEELQGMGPLWIYKRQ